MKPPPTPVEHVNAKIKNCGVTPISEDHDEMWGVPTLTELGFDTSNLPPPKWQGKCALSARSAVILPQFK